MKGRNFARLSDDKEVEEIANGTTRQYEVCLRQDTAEGEAVMYLTETEALRLGAWLIAHRWTEAVA